MTATAEAVREELAGVGIDVHRIEIPDAEDACPDQIGERSTDPKKHGCPVIADRLYGRVDPDKFLHLHSRGIVLPLSKTKPPIVVVAPPPPHMIEALKACGFSPAP